jgi:membrane protease YdiL (CAAX protease family)
MAIEKSNKNVRNIAVGVLFVLALFWLINPLTRFALGIYLVFLGVSILIYSLRDYQRELVGISSRNLIKSFIWSGLVSFGFFLVTRFIPSFSILYPQLPNAVSDNLRVFIIFAVAPICEELFFRGSLLGYLRSFSKPSSKRIWISIILTALAFSIFHIVAYAGDIAGLSNFSQVLGAFGSNVSAFFSAMIAGTLFGYLAVKTDNLTSAIIAHSLLNIIIYTSLTIIA